VNLKRLIGYGIANLGKRPWVTWLNRAEHAMSLDPTERLSTDFGILWEADLTSTNLVQHNARMAKYRQKQKAPRVVHWLVPDFTMGSGGHRTILRFVGYLQSQGVENHIFVMPRSVHGDKLSNIVTTKFWETGAIFHSTPNDLGKADIFFATSWETAYKGFHLEKPLFKAYFVQDDESLFYPAGSFRQFALNSYKMGYYGCCASEWLTRLARERGMEASAFSLGYDPKEFFPKSGVERDRNTVAVYLRPNTERRGFELMIGALTLLKRRMPHVRIKIFGSDDLLEERLPFKVDNLGIIDNLHLRHLFSEAKVLVLCSFTNYSLLPQEALACGCHVLDLDVEGTREVFGQNSPVSLAPPYALGLASCITDILAQENTETFRAKVMNWLENKTWEKIFDSLWKNLKSKWEQ